MKNARKEDKETRLKNKCNIRDNSVKNYFKHKLKKKRKD